MLQVEVHQCILLEKYLLGQLNLELLEEEDNKSKKMADEIIEQGIKK